MKNATIFVLRRCAGRTARNICSDGSPSPRYESLIAELIKLAVRYLLILIITGNNRVRGSAYVCRVYVASAFRVSPRERASKWHAKFREIFNVLQKHYGINIPKIPCLVLLDSISAIDVSHFPLLAPFESATRVLYSDLDITWNSRYRLKPAEINRSVTRNTLEFEQRLRFYHLGFFSSSGSHDVRFDERPSF